MVETLLEFLTAWGSQCGDSSYIAAFDVNGNCQIDTSDLLSLLADLASDGLSAGKETVSARK